MRKILALLAAAALSALVGIVSTDAQVTGTNGSGGLSSSAQVIALWTGTCNSSSYLNGAGACTTPSGAGTVTTTGTPASGNLTAFSGSTSITNSNLSGDVTTSGTLAATVVRLNGTSLAGLATGLLKNTTATGVPSIATSADVIADWSGTCSSATFLRGDGSCQTPAGGGNVSNSGTPTVHQTGVWVTSTTLEGVGPGSTGQAFVSGGASADPSFSASLSGVTSVNSSTVPASTTLAGLGTVETWTAAQTFTNSDLLLLGSSTGATTFTSANASVTNYTITVPAATDTLVTLAATQTLTNKSIAATEVNSGTLAAAQMPALTGDCTTSAGAVATTCTKINGTTVPSSAGMITTTSSGQIQAQAVVAATGVTGPTYDYSPTGFNTTTAVLYITPASGGSTYGGLAAQSALQQVYIVNAEAAGGADNIILLNQSSSDTTAANRFLTSATTSLAIPPGGRVLCVYLPSTVSRWSCQ
jgi:hypothetical protein